MLPLKNIFHIFDVSWVLDAASWQLLKVWIYTWLWSLTTLGAQSAKVAPKSSYAPDDYRVCTTREALYHFGNRSSYFMSSLDCGNCSRQYGVGRVGYTNVILVISKMPCAPVFCDPPPTPLQAPIEVDDPAPCQHPLRYRRRPDKCYADHAKEDYRVCGRASTSVTSTVALISSALALAASAVLAAL